MRILVIDNYDSFTYNLVQYIGEVEDEPRVVRNDEVEAEQIIDDPPDSIVISPGPGGPQDAGISLGVIEELGESVPILGVCLGHQCIAEAYGGNVIHAERLLHGKTSQIYHSDTVLYEDLPNPIEATRYHSLIVEEDTLPDEFSVDAVSERDEVMGIHHSDHPVLGVQFHPESILTQEGRKLLKNFFNYSRNVKPLGESERPSITGETEEVAQDG